MSEGPEIWSFGLGSYGRLGHGDTNNQLAPTAIRALKGKSVAGVAAGGDHCFLWTTTNEVYAFGRGSSGALGLNDVQNRVVPTLVPGFSGKEIEGGAAGAAHSLIWTTSKDLFATGQGKEGALGLGDTSSRMSFTLVRALSGKNIAGVACGDSHTIVWLSDKGAYAFGQARYGQLGTGETSNTSNPVAIPAFAAKQVTGAACGGSHTLVWTAQNEIYSFGYGKNGQLGHGDSSNQLNPTLIQSLKGKPIAGAACGASHSIVWTQENEVYTFGHGGNGRLGHGDNNNKLVPTLVQFFRDMKIAGAQCGPNHTFVWTTEGEVYSFGWGSYGQLGHGDTSHRPTPTIITALKGKNVTGVACGGATIVWSSTVPARLKGLDQVAVHQLQTILQPPQKSEHPLTLAAMSSLKEAVTHKELTVFVNSSESLAEMLPSTQEDGKESYLRLQLEKATQKRDVGLQRSDVVAVVEEERKIVDLRTQLLEIAQEHPKKVASILEKAEEGLPTVLGLEEKVRMQQKESEDGLQLSEEEIERCKQVAADESTKLTEAQMEVERLKRCLQDAELAVMRQQDQVALADRKLAEVKAQHAAHRAVIQACENAQNVIQEAYEQRIDLKKQLAAILATSQAQKEREQNDQHQYFSQMLPEFMERERYYLQRAEQARRMIDPRLEKEMQSVAQVMGALVGACRKALNMIPDATIPTMIASPVKSEALTADNFTTPLRGFVPAMEDEGSTSTPPSPLPELTRRSVLSVPRDKLGTRFQKVVSSANVDLEHIIEGLKRYAEAEELPKCARLMSEFQEKLEDFEGAGDAAEDALAKAVYWLYSTDSWVYERVNSALMNDSGVALSDLGAYVRCMVESVPRLHPTLGYTGRLYKRLRLTEVQLALYTEGKTFYWGCFVSASTAVDSHEGGGRQLIIINIPPESSPVALNITSISASHEEEVVLCCYCPLRVIQILRGTTDYTGIDDVLEVEVVSPVAPE